MKKKVKRKGKQNLPKLKEGQEQPEQKEELFSTNLSFDEVLKIAASGAGVVKKKGK